MRVAKTWVIKLGFITINEDNNKSFSKWTIIPRSWRMVVDNFICSTSNLAGPAIIL